MPTESKEGTTNGNTDKSRVPNQDASSHHDGGESEESSTPRTPPTISDIDDFPNVKVEDLEPHDTGSRGNGRS